MVNEEMSFNFFLILALVAICVAEQNSLCNLCIEHYEVHFCEIILN